MLYCVAAPPLDSATWAIKPALKAVSQAFCCEPAAASGGTKPPPCSDQATNP